MSYQGVTPVSLTDFGTEQKSIDRRRKLAELMQRQAVEPIEAPTSGGQVGPISPVSVLAKMLQGYMSGRNADKLDEREAEIKKQSSAESGKFLARLLSNGENVDTTPTTPKEVKFPVPGLPDAQATLDLPTGIERQSEFKPNTQADRMALLMQGATSGREDIASMIPALTALIKPEEFEGSEYGRYSRDWQGNITQIQAPRVAKKSTKNPYPAIGADGKPGMYRDDDDGNPVAVPGMMPYSAPGTNVRIDMPKPDSAFSATFGAEAAKDAMTTIKAGRAAPGIIDSANRVIKVLTDPKIKPITGSFAEYRLAASKALYGDTPEAAATENLVADLARSTLDAIPASGLGGGQGFTERDKQFLIDAAAGRIQQTKENLLRMAKLRKTIGEANIRNANRVMKQVSGMPGYENMSGLMQPIPESAGTLPQGVDQRTWDHMTPEEKALFK